MTLLSLVVTTLEFKKQSAGHIPRYTLKISANCNISLGLKYQELEKVFPYIKRCMCWICWKKQV